MESYEKKYKEALGWMQSLYPTMTGADKEDAEHFFPELKESEDERIRKALIFLIKQGEIKGTIRTYLGVSEKDILAWVEKQGKTSPILSNSTNIGKVEQKLVDNIEPKFKVGQTIIYKGTENIAPTKMTISDIANGQYWDDNCCIVPISDQDEWELVEQKPAWSEEDQKIWEEISDLLWEGFKKTYTKFSWDEIKGWIKPKIESFKDRVQPKQEWSEEDEKEMATIEHYLNNCGASITSILWLKSLRPHSQWKPSDEQMEALLKLEEMHVLEHEKNQENAHLYMVVKSIREQLLKLREGQL